MKRSLSWWVAALLVASMAGCGTGDEDGPRLGLALDNAALRDDIRVLQIEGYRDRGLSCIGHALSAAAPASADLGPLPIQPTEWGVTFPAEGGSWVLYVTAGNDEFPVTGPKRLAEGCLGVSISAGSSPTLTIQVFDLRPEYCGDGERDPGEDCDDGNLVPDDGCSPTCMYESGVCGNSRVDSDETCDDGNTAAGDGCDAACQTESFVLPQRPENLNQEQAQPRIAAGNDTGGAGGFAVVWADNGDLDGSSWGTAIGFFDEQGQPTPNTTGGRFELMYNNPVTTLGQDSASVGWGSAGYLATFVDASSTDAYLMPFSATRARMLAAPERVSASGGDVVETQAAVGSNAAVPGYVAAWLVGVAPARKVWVRTFSGTWPSTSTDVQVQPTGTEDEYLPATAMAPDGSFAVAWVQGTGDPSIRLARFTAAGTMSGAVEAVAGAGDMAVQTEPGLAYDATGRLLVTWADAPSGTVMARLYDAAGTASAPFSVSPGGLFPGAVESGRLTTSVAATGGIFLVVWATELDTNVAVSGRLVTGANTFERNRFPEGGDSAFRISPATRAKNGRVAITPGGRAMVVWQDRDPFGADVDAGVRGRVFSVP